MKFGRWSVLSEYGRKDGEATWLCRCDCGTEEVIKGSQLRSGATKSCGCLRAELPSANKTHGQSKTCLYKIWKNMKSRCYNPSASRCEDYGGRGITMCDEWLNSFEPFCKWAWENGYNDKMSIERIDVNGNYSPSNCSFIPMAEQSVNRRNTLLTVGGITKPKKEWAEECGINLRTLSSRINKLGWTPERAVTVAARSYHG